MRKEGEPQPDRPTLLRDYDERQRTRVESERQIKALKTKAMEILERRGSLLVVGRNQGEIAFLSSYHDEIDFVYGYKGKFDAIKEPIVVYPYAEGVLRHVVLMPFELETGEQFGLPFADIPWTNLPVEKNKLSNRLLLPYLQFDKGLWYSNPEEIRTGILGPEVFPLLQEYLDYWGSLSFGAD